MYPKQWPIYNILYPLFGMKGHAAIMSGTLEVLVCFDALRLLWEVQAHARPSPFGDFLDTAYYR